MEWNKIFITGIEKIDEQHKTLFDEITKLKHLTKDPGDKNKSEIHEVLLFLVKYTKIHFSYEEEYMASINYSRLEEHKLIHKGFLLELKKIIDRYTLEGTFKEVELYLFLIKWLQQHIAVEDQKYVNA